MSGVKSGRTDSSARTGISIFVSLSVSLIVFFFEESPMKPSDILFFLRRLDKLIACFVTVDDHALKQRGRKKLICVDK